MNLPRKALKELKIVFQRKLKVAIQQITRYPVHREHARALTPLQRVQKLVLTVQSAQTVLVEVAK